MKHGRQYFWNQSNEYRNYNANCNSPFRPKKNLVALRGYIRMTTFICLVVLFFLKLLKVMHHELPVGVMRKYSQKFGKLSLCVVVILVVIWENHTDYCQTIAFARKRSSLKLPPDTPPKPDPKRQPPVSDGDTNVDRIRAILGRDSSHCFHGLCFGFIFARRRRDNAYDFMRARWRVIPEIARFL